jgi:hypothetical protein
MWVDGNRKQSSASEEFSDKKWTGFEIQVLERHAATRWRRIKSLIS